jgi:hypothetical protein
VLNSFSNLASRNFFRGLGREPGFFFVVVDVDDEVVVGSLLVDAE